MQIFQVQPDNETNATVRNDEPMFERGCWSEQKFQILVKAGPR